MTSKERFYKVFNGEIPDRVPVTTFIIDQGHFITQAYPDIDPMDLEVNLLKIVELQKQFGMDVMVRPIFDYQRYKHMVWGGVNTAVQTEDWEVKTEIVQNGPTNIERSIIRTPMGNLTQDFSINQLRSGTFGFSCTKPPVESPEDLDIVMKYEPKLDEDFKPYVKRIMKKVKEAVGDDGVVCPYGGHAPFNFSALITKLSDMYSLFLEEPEYYEKLMNFSYERVRDYVDAILEGEPDLMYVGGNVPGGFLGRKMYDEYILAHERKFVEYAQRTGVPAMYHNCGHIMNLVESYRDLGCRIIEPFSPAPLGDADLSKAKELSQGAYIILGGVDQVNVLQNGTPELVAEVTKQTVLTGKPGGKFLLQSADLLEYGTPFENVEAYVKAGIENAWY